MHTTRAVSVGHLVQASPRPLLVSWGLSEISGKRATRCLPAEQHRPRYPHSQPSVLPSITANMNPGYGQWSRIPDCPWPWHHKMSPNYQKTSTGRSGLSRNTAYKCRCVFGEHPHCISAHLLSGFRKNWKIIQM